MKCGARCAVLPEPTDGSRTPSVSSLDPALSNASKNSAANCNTTSRCERVIQKSGVTIEPHDSNQRTCAFLDPPTPTATKADEFPSLKLQCHRPPGSTNCPPANCNKMSRYEGSVVRCRVRGAGCGVRSTATTFFYPSLPPLFSWTASTQTISSGPLPLAAHPPRPPFGFGKRKRLGGKPQTQRNNQWPDGCAGGACGAGAQVQIHPLWEDDDVQRTAIHHRGGSESLFSCSS